LSKKSDRQTAAALALACCLAALIALVPPIWSVLILVGAVVLLVTLLRPQVGLLIIAPAVPFGSLRQITVSGINIGATDLLVLLTLAGWLAQGVARRQIRLRLPSLTWPLLAFITALLVSMLNATSMQAGLKELAKWIEVLLIYLLVANAVDERWEKALTIAIVGSGVLAALHGIYQFLFRVGPEGFLLFGRFMRASGAFGQPNPYAAYLGLTLPIAVGLGLAYIVRAEVPLRGIQFVGVAAAAALVGLALLMSWSRGALLGFAAAAAVMVVIAVFWSRRGVALASVVLVLVLAGMALGGLSLVPSSIIERFSDFVPYLGVTDVRGAEITDANFSVLERMAHWQSAVTMWRDSFWLGVGAGNYGAVYRDYALPMWPYPLGHAHNYYLNIAAETGFLGLTVYAVFMIVSFLACADALRQAEGWRWGLMLGIMGALVHFAVHSLFDNLFVHAMYLHLAMMLGLVARIPKKGVGMARTRESGVPRGGSA
jgi:O-antigen ligase